MGLAATILLDLVLRSRFLVEHYTSSGAVPIGMLARPGLPDAAGLLSLGPWRILAPHLWNDTTVYQSLLFAIAGAAAIALLLGYKTRATTIVSWFLLVSLHCRNPLVLNGGDELFRALMFWSIFLPWGSRFAMDRRDREPGHTLSIATVAFVLQIAVVFLLAGARKTGLEWTREGTAIFFALSSHDYRGPLAEFLVSTLSMDSLRTLTRAVRIIEVVSPILLLLPTRSALPRLIGLGLLLASLLGFMLGLRVGLFPWIALCGLAALVPWPISASASTATGERTPEPVNQQPYFLRQALLLLLIWTGAWNVAAATETLEELHPVLRLPVLSVRLDQNWNMFTPAPPGQNSWFTAPAKLKDGTRANVLRPGARDPFRRPEFQPEFAYSRSRKLQLERFALGGYPTDAFADLLCKRWNENTSPDRRVVHYEYILHQEQVTTTGSNFPLPPRVVFEKECESPR